VLKPDAGKILFEGREVHFANPRAAQACGIAMIFQELNLIPQLSVAENIFLGREPLNRFGLIDFSVMNERAEALLRQLDLAVAPTTLAGSLRVGQQQVVEIAKALADKARVIIMDEPTSAITEREIEVLFEIISHLKRQGVAIAYITHKLDELTRIGDDAVVMRDGKMIGSAPLKDLRHDDIVRMMVGRELAQLHSKSRRTPGEEMLRADRISLRHPQRPGDFVVKELSLSVCRGEVLGIFGLMGAGRTELLETLYGLHSEDSTGEIHIEGEPVVIRSPAKAIASGLALAPEDRKGEGLVLQMTVSENTSLASLGRTERWGLLNAAAERQHVTKAIEPFRVKTPSLQQIIRNLSGGNQQKVILAKWLAAGVKILLLDEPTRGIDVNAKKEIYSLIDELTRNGLAVVMVSSELPEILAVADRILVMCEGRKTAEYSRAEATEENIMRAALPRN
jgi:ribose transport system ATP-binding protein